MAVSPYDQVVVLVSGGVDSTTLLAHFHSIGRYPHPLVINYGQRHAREIRSARDVMSHYHHEYKEVDLSGLKAVMLGSSQTDTRIPVPEGHYSDRTMEATVVPNRNMVLLSVAAAYAISLGVKTVAYAAHAGDHPIYPDCRPEFIHAMVEPLTCCHTYPLGLETPFLEWTKAKIVRHGLELDVPFNKTWSCYAGGEIHCGRCGTCVERLEAFDLAGETDPVAYQDREFYKHAVDA